MLLFLEKNREKIKKYEKNKNQKFDRDWMNDIAGTEKYKIFRL